MKILLTNDDGIDGKGMTALAHALSSCADVYLLAPDEDNSGVSHRITMDKPLRITKHADNIYSCSGAPVDCVITALRSDLFGVSFDAVFAGINRGANMGTDVVYSGTAAAARQAALYGVPGIAVSLDSDGGKYEYSALAEFTARNSEKLVSLCSENLFVSINARSASSYAGVSFAPLCRRDYRDTVKIFTGSDGVLYSMFSGGSISTEGDDGCDYNTVRQGKIAVSLITAEPVFDKKAHSVCCSGQFVL
jgi:5'-nucleotidase